jgi:hypothetical protein
MHHLARFLILLLAFAGGQTFAQTIRGEVIDKESKKPVTGVSIENVYTALSVNTGDDGGFIIAASKDQLLEFSKPGYKTTKVRIPKGYVPSYFKIVLEHGFVKVEDMLASDNRYNYKRDSLRYHELYKHELDFEKLSAVGSIAHPFSALSKRNREIWKFQADYDQFEQEKYVDNTFNPAIVNRVTGLTGDSLKRYMVRFRPEYEELRNMTDYSFFTYIKKTVHMYRHPNMPRGAQ